MIRCEMGTPRYMLILLIVLLVAAGLCFAADAFLRVPPAYPRLTALGLLLWLVAYAIPTLPIH